MRMGVKFYLIGSNIGTSLSPRIHNLLFGLKEKLGYSYHLHQEGTLPTLNSLETDPFLGGISITIPFKQAYADEIAQSRVMVQGDFASRHHVINTLVKKSTQTPVQFLAYNTDIYGIEMTLRKWCDWGNVVVLGAGATAQCFCHYLEYSPMCASVSVVNRSHARTRELAAKFKKVHAYGDVQNGGKYCMVVNTLPSQIVWQNKQHYRQIIQQVQLDSEVSFMDVNYRGQESPILHQLQARGLKIQVFTGLDMLIWQAIEQNRLFCQDGPQQLTQQQKYYQIISESLRKNQ